VRCASLASPRHSFWGRWRSVPLRRRRRFTCPGITPRPRFTRTTTHQAIPPTSIRHTTTPRLTRRIITPPPTPRTTTRRLAATTTRMTAPMSVGAGAGAGTAAAGTAGTGGGKRLGAPTGKGAQTRSHPLGEVASFPRGTPSTRSGLANFVGNFGGARREIVLEQPHEVLRL